MDRELIDHHDGHGLTESIKILADEPGPGGASHRYLIQVEAPDGQKFAVGEIQFQKGPRNVEGSTPGVVESALLAIVVDRMRSFNSGELRNRQNALVQTKCEEAIHWLRDRADERARRGVLGTMNK